MHAANAQHIAIDTPPLSMVTLAERITRTLAVARALIVSGRDVDLAGIEDGIGMLCAKTLDLPNEQARSMLPALYDMRVQVDRLSVALRQIGSDPELGPGSG
jgi:hypothetical protein